MQGLEAVAKMARTIMTHQAGIVTDNDIGD